jgi:DnaJ-class molecular chaperone
VLTQPLMGRCGVQGLMPIFTNNVEAWILTDARSGAKKDAKPAQCGKCEGKGFTINDRFVSYRRPFSRNEDTGESEHGVDRR